jgi:hypothetical protein
MRVWARACVGVAIAVTVLFATAAARPDTASASCGWAAAYAPFGGGWSRDYHSTCWYTTTIVERPQTYVSWEISFGDAQACVKAKGYRWRDGKAYWVSLGCGTSGGGYVHWGQYWHQVADYHHVKTKSLMFPLGAPVEFM